jgi:hypothetical protein
LNADNSERSTRFTPRFWHGLAPADFWRLVRANRFRLSPGGALAAVGITGSGLWHLAAGAACAAWHGRRLRAARLTEPPLFILGHWRTGTTFLHELLLRDPRHLAPTTYQCFSPRHFPLTEPWLTPLTGWMLPEKRLMDDVATGWDKAQEDEFALLCLGLPTLYRSWAFPLEGPADAAWLTLDAVPEAERRRWKEALRRFVVAVASRRVGRAGRVVLKSPPHTARIRVLLELFPDARFVHLCRDPLSLFPSTVRLWETLCAEHSLQCRGVRPAWIEEEVLGNLVRMHEAYERDRGLIPAGRLVELRYEEVAAEPEAALRRIYAELGLGGFAEAEPRFAAHLGTLRGYRPNRHTLAPETRALVASRWRAYAERWGYEVA